jgi:OmpA-OmpF porin, OOP family
MRILHAIVAGERSPDVLAAHRDVRCAASAAPLRAALTTGSRTPGWCRGGLAFGREQAINHLRTHAALSAGGAGGPDGTAGCVRRPRKALTPAVEPANHPPDDARTTDCFVDTNPRTGLTATLPGQEGRRQRSSRWSASTGRRPMNCVRLAALALLPLLLTVPARAQQDVEGCKDHPLFNRLPGFYITNCDSSQFDLRRFPQGPLKDTPEGDKRAGTVDVEGPVWKMNYELMEGVTRPSALQIMRNFQNAAKQAGGTVQGEYAGWCQGMLDESLAIGNGCTNFGVSMRFTRGPREVWAYVQAMGQGEGYELVIAEREAMKQDIVTGDLLEKIEKDGFVALYINFDTGKATISPESHHLLDEVAAALKGAPALQLEVAGHTDNVGTAETNQQLSEERARAVAAALTARGVAASRLSARGHGQSSPLADNRTEEGRAKNRRVELVKQ